MKRWLLVALAAFSLSLGLSAGAQEMNAQSVALPAPTPLFYISGGADMTDAALGDTLVDPIFGLTTVPMSAVIRVEVAKNPPGSVYAYSGRFIYWDLQWRALSGPLNNIVTYFGTPLVVDKAAGTATVQWATKYTTALDLATVKLTRMGEWPSGAPKYGISFTVKSYYANAPTFSVSGTLQESAVVGLY